MPDAKKLVDETADSIAAYGRYLATSFGGRVAETAGVVMCDAGLAWRARNMVVPLRSLDGEVCRDLADRLIEFYGSRDRWVLWSTYPIDLDTNDFRLAETHAVMTRFAENVQRASDVPGLSIEEVADDDGVRLFEQVRQTADVYPPEYDPAPGRFFDARVLGKDHRLWLGYVDGEPVATAAAFHHDHVNLIKNVSTAAAYLGRGIAQVMSDHAVRSTEKRPILDSSDSGAPVYRKLGFEEIGRVQFWTMT
ncbi:MAG: hypothetical protein DLM55_00735 [Acidimicrobiales bacterium]|nr:MAG: hypothetical protein DLM55_00735 [Acidimicrobiales bacterium]